MDAGSRPPIPAALERVALPAGSAPRLVRHETLAENVLPESVGCFASAPGRCCLPMAPRAACGVPQGSWRSPRKQLLGEGRDRVGEGSEPRFIRGFFAFTPATESSRRNKNANRIHGLWVHVLNPLVRSEARNSSRWNLEGLVPMEGIEPPHPCEYQILSLARLPIPPHRLPTMQ